MKTTTTHIHTSLARKLACLFMLAAGVVHAQQDAGFSQYFFNQLYTNPAYAGSREALSGTLVHRSQWVALPGAPTTQSLTLHTPLGITRSGVGLMVYNDKAGPLSHTGFQGAYSYYVPLGQYRLAFGLSGGANLIRVAYDDINVEDGTDPAFNGRASSWIPEASFGVYIYRNRFYAAASALHLFQPSFNLGGTTESRLMRHYYVTAGYVFKLNETVDFRPSVLVKGVTAAAPVTDLNASFIFYKRFFIGAGYRGSKRVNLDGVDNQLIAIAEFSITPVLRLAYSYDWYLNQSGNYNSGTHEIMLGWDIRTNKTRMTSPKYF